MTEGEKDLEKADLLIEQMEAQLERVLVETKKLNKLGLDLKKIKKETKNEWTSHFMHRYDAIFNRCREIDQAIYEVVN